MKPYLIAILAYTGIMLLSKVALYLYQREKTEPFIKIKLNFDFYKLKQIWTTDL